MNAFKVTYNVKHIDKRSSLYGLVSFDQSCKFPTLQTAIKFAREMKNKRSNKIQVVGIPVVEKITSI